MQPRVRLVVAALATLAVLVGGVLSVAASLTQISRPRSSWRWTAWLMLLAPVVPTYVARKVIGGGARECSIVGVTIGARLGLGAAIGAVALASRAGLQNTVRVDSVEIGLILGGVLLGAYCGTFWARRGRW